MTNQPSNPRPRVLSGMRPTGKLHLGNYVGALQNWVKLQDSHDCFFFVADWHALTTDYDDTSRLANSTLEVVVDFLAAGLDPEKCVIFVQSHVKQHAELHLLFSMITPLGWLERVPTYKEQQQNMPDKDLHMYGFLGYPLLMAADILIYRPGFVPVGEDQDVHVELTREVARRFNQFYKLDGKPVFPEPQTLFTKSPKLLGMDKRKMSKSYGNSILLSDEAAKVEEKIKNSVTDRPKPADHGDPNRCPVGNLHQIFSDAARLAHITRGCTQASITCVECKALAVPSVNVHLAPIRERRSVLAQDRKHLRDIIQQGAEKATKAAEDTMAAARESIGLLRISDVENLATGLEGLRQLIQEGGRKTGGDPASVEQGMLARKMWIGYATGSYRLRDVGHKTFVTAHNRRIGIPAVAQLGPDSWQLEIPDRHFDAIAVVCFDDEGDRFRFHDFVIPMRLLTEWKSFTREGKNVRFQVRHSAEQFLLEPDSATPQDITKFQDNYSILE